MTIAARINLQNGVPEDTRYEWTNYHNNNDALDNYILEKEKFKRKYLDYKQQEKAKKEYEKQVKKAGEDVAAAAYKELDKMFKLSK